jgi:hypothetical protein
VAALAVVYTLAVTLLCGWYQPWYAAWPLLFLAALPAERWALGTALALTAGALLVPTAINYAPALSGRDVHDLAIEVLGVVLLLAPLAGAALVLRRIPLPRSSTT